MASSDQSQGIKRKRSDDEDATSLRPAKQSKPTRGMPDVTKPRESDLPAYRAGQDYLANAFKAANQGVALDIFPELFAENRSSFAQTMPKIHNLHQGGVAYRKEGKQVPLSMILLADTGTRGMISATRIVTRLPGNQKSAGDGTYIAAKSFEESDYVMIRFRALMADPQPVFMILSEKATDKYRHLVKFPAGVSICPMGWFWPVGLWPEIVDGFLSYNIELEVIDYKSIWWIPTDARKQEMANLKRDLFVAASRCDECGTVSKRQTYAVFAICCNPKCAWVGTDDGIAPGSHTLTRSEDFLNRRSTPPNASAPSWLPDNNDLLKRIEEEDANPANWLDKTFSSSHNEGIQCPQCKICIARDQFDSWNCITPDCGYTLQKAPALEPLLKMVDREQSYEAPEVRQEFKDLVSCYDIGDIEGYPCHLVELWNGAYALLMEEPFVKSKAKGRSRDQTKDMLKLACKGELQLKKAFKASTAIGRNVNSNNFYRSYGVPYRFGMQHIHFTAGHAVETESFNDLSRLRSLGMKKLGLNPDYNLPTEAMTTAYLQGQLMKRHVDQNTICPIVTRCLGGSEDFRINVITSRYYDTTRNGDPGGPDAPYPGTYRDTKLRQAWKQHRMGTPQADEAAYTAAKTKIHEFKRNEHVGPEVLCWTLHHGGVLFQFGDLFQNVFDHSVTPHTIRLGQIYRFVEPEGGDEELAKNKILVDRGHSEKIAAWLKEWKRKNIDKVESSDDDAMEVDI